MCCFSICLNDESRCVALGKYHPTKLKVPFSADNNSVILKCSLICVQSHSTLPSKHRNLNNLENAIIVLDSMEIRKQTECENCIATKEKNFHLLL